MAAGCLRGRGESILGGGEVDACQYMGEVVSICSYNAEFGRSLEDEDGLIEDDAKGRVIMYVHYACFERWVQNRELTNGAAVSVSKDDGNYKIGRCLTSKVSNQIA